jgi:glycosyltransferase involved in cell wall biosynthesis
MNNNGFAIMRYFRDLGVEAHLFLYVEDGRGSLSHFGPEADTWDIGKWASIIHQTEISNGYPGLLGRPQRLQLPVSKSALRRLFADYNNIVGSGIAPAVLGRIGRNLEIFYPYSTGVEHVGTHEVKVSMRRSPVARVMLKYVRDKQINGIKNAKYCINAEMGLTRSVLSEVGKEFLSMAVPMVYNKEVPRKAGLSKRLLDICEKLRGCEFVVVSHARLMWVRNERYLKKEWENCSKHNDWVVKGYAAFIKRHPNVRCLLVLVEYGPDIDATKELCEKLGISGKVLWLEKMPRKEVMHLLRLCDIGVGEFHVDKGFLWGGTGWEVLAAGKPLLQSFQFDDGIYQSIYGHPPPPMLPAGSEQEIAAHLEDMYLNPAKREAIGKGAAEWFDQHNGIGLAAKWLKLLQT